jgi:glycosyltransferase involved in cell wall biosynthesis
MTRGVKFISYPDHSGYGLAALAYVRALNNAGVPGWWVPLIYRDGRQHAWQPADGREWLAVAWEADKDAGLQDVPALLEACAAKPYDTVMIQTVPEHWPQLVEPGKRNIGYTVWETDALPRHWLPLLNLPDKVLVPSAMNQSLFVAAGVTRPVVAVPHIRRHAFNAVSTAEAAGLRAHLGVPDDHFVFYSIGTWDPRKALADLVTAFCRAFCGDDKVSLVVKTSRAPHPLALEQVPPGGIPDLVAGLRDGVAAATGTPRAHVAAIAADGVAGRVIDTLHATGDCFVSLTHGEGWGMGAFDAATLGKPVLITGYGGPAEYLPRGYPGLIDYAMVPVSGWSPQASFHLPQRWAQPEALDVRRKLRRMVARHADFLDAAAIAGEAIVNRYAEPVVARQLIAAIDG